MYYEERFKMHMGRRTMRMVNIMFDGSELERIKGFLLPLKS